MPFLAPALPAIAGGLASAGAAKLLGGSKTSKAAVQATNDALVRNVSTPAFSTSLSNGTLLFNRNPVVNQLLGGGNALYGQLSDKLGTLASQVTPGVGKLSQATSNVFAAARQRLLDASRSAVGNLRQDLARRKVLGSSFAQDTINRTVDTYNQTINDLTAQEQQAQAANVLQELDLNRQLVQDQYSAKLSAIQMNLNQLQLESSQATSLATGSQSALQNYAQLMGNLASQQAAGKASIWSPVISSVGDAVSNAAQSLFGR